MIFTKMYHKKQSNQVQIKSCALHGFAASRLIFEGRPIFEEIRYVISLGGTLLGKVAHSYNVVKL